MADCICFPGLPLSNSYFLYHSSRYWRYTSSLTGLCQYECRDGSWKLEEESVSWPFLLLKATYSWLHDLFVSALSGSLPLLSFFSSVVKPLFAFLGIHGRASRISLGDLYPFRTHKLIRCAEFFWFQKLPLWGARHQDVGILGANCLFYHMSNLSSCASESNLEEHYIISH